ncbi:hypothetical protein [Pedobacter sp. W3I1]|uniref:hypothetical protein n=1 Tax=Pedobacter sp. W3I1 TaxID=3042291 RepID=UPI0027D824A9|nr:hypothetical protein [Pedobacter sp. W3I1]
MKRSVGLDNRSMNTLIRQPELKVHALMGAESVVQLKKSATILQLRNFSANQLKDPRDVPGEIKVLTVLATKNGLQGLL